MPPTDRLRLAYLADPNSVHTRRWLAAFADRGHEVHLLEGFGAEIRPGLDDRVRLHRYEAYGRPRWPLVSILRGRANLRRLLDDLRPDLLHAHYVRRFGWQALLSGFHPYVISPWGSDVLIAPRRSGRTRWWNRFALRNADLVTVGPDVLRDAVLAEGVRAERIATVRFGVDSGRFTPGAAAPATSSRLAADGRRVVLSPRAIRPLYRHDVVVAAFSRLPPDTLLVMSARDADPAQLAERRGQIEALGLTERVRILDDVAEDELPELNRLAAVVVSVPESDAFPVSLLEAMSCATPIVASDLPAVRPVLAAIAPEQLVPIGDPDALAGAMHRILDLDDQARRRLGAALRDFVVREADFDRNMDRMEELYRRLADPR